MLDIRFIRENAEMVAEKARQKGYEVDVPKLLELDDRRRQLLSQVEQKRKDRNDHADAMKTKPPTAEDIETGRRLKTETASLEAELQPLEAEYEALLKAIPNMPAQDVPVGASEADNVVAKEWGDKPKFDFTAKTHWQLAEERGLIDKQRAAKVAGSRFAYIKGDLVRLQLAIMQFTIQTLTDEQKLKQIIDDNGLELSAKPFIPLLPPAMIKTDVYEKMDRLDPRDDRYKTGEDEDNLWLQGSAEHTIGPMYMDETLPAEQLPIRYIGFLTSFRREAGTYGKDTEGIIRMHQFDKLEMESFSLPENGSQEHSLMVALQEYLMQQLGLPYRVINKCTADIGKPNVKGIDLEVWLPGAAIYKETHTADYMGDYQTRRLQTRAKKDDQLVYVHTNDATAFALGRTLVAIIENYQTANGRIRVPLVLQPFMAGQAEI